MSNRYREEETYDLLFAIVGIASCILGEVGGLHDVDKVRRKGDICSSLLSHQIQKPNDSESKGEVSGRRKQVHDAQTD